MSLDSTRFWNCWHSHQISQRYNFDFISKSVFKTTDKAYIYKKGRIFIYTVKTEISHKGKVPMLGWTRQKIHLFHSSLLSSFLGFDDFFFLFSLKKKRKQCLHARKSFCRHLGSISSTFYAQLLRTQIPKAQKKTVNSSSFLRFRDLRL